MLKAARKNEYFTKHLFRAGLGCPTKLFYKAKNYPENRQALPFVAHNYHNKSQFKALVRSLYPGGVYVNEPVLEDRFQETGKYLLQDEITLFDAAFIWQDFMAKVPIIHKNGQDVKIFHIETKAFNPNKHQLTNHRGEIYPKWEDYLVDFTYLTFVVGKLYPKWNITPILVLPNKVETVRQDNLHEKLNSDDRQPKIFGESVEDRLGLMVEIDVSELIRSVWEGAAFEDTDFSGRSFENVIQELQEVYFSGEKYPERIGSKCKNCEFRIENVRDELNRPNGFRECWNHQIESVEDVPADMVFDLIGPGTDTWVERGLYFQHQIPGDEVVAAGEIERSGGRITERQRQALQILKAKGLYVPEEIIKPQLLKELSRWKYPIHFLDFEAGNYTIPIKSNRKPYHLVVFQFSCHSLYEDGSWQHFEWIDDLNSGYSNYECIRQLRKVPDIMNGTLVQYSDFERNALKIIRKELMHEEEILPERDELIDWIGHLVTRRDSNVGNGPFMADLSRLVRNFYYNNRMENSLSIKDVVQSVMTLSPYLKEIYEKPYTSSNFDSIVWWQPLPEEDLVQNPYSILQDLQGENGVRRGTEAMVVYGKLLSNGMVEAEKEKHKQALLKYCELDTLAMLMIYQHWHEMSKSQTG